MIELSAEMRDKFSGADAFEQVMALEGDVYRAKEGRRTLLFTHNGREYFAKIHHGIGWGEIWKNLSSFRLPVTDASNEWKAVDLLEKSGVATVKIVGKGSRGANPAKRESFVIMEALDERVEVEDFLKVIPDLPAGGKLKLKRAIIRRVADAARRMHGAGMNHRDFYLCHFHILERDWSNWQPDEELRLPLIDLHRAQIRDKVPHRWLAKDLGALLFSAIDCPVTDRDFVAFLKIYLGDQWREKLEQDQELWQSVVKRAKGFYRRHRGHDPILPGVFSKL
ncbi:lipopolysaccharide core heptose(I) kinase RfaP [Oceaniferula spumae]|uniref:Lipopolysaccharide core heptose(I) kinase RfaP n=1 Tax=Oceaniferula spumae TaxID=2979115 RepID=A0AAT9FR41_9BACT